jgi:transcriptional regulator with XRE-family HTH domain
LTGTLAAAPGDWATRSGAGWSVAPRDVGEARPGRSARRRTLTEAREAAGLTMTELARALHVSRPNLSLWEKGRRRPARCSWPQIGAVLDLAPDDVAALFADHPPARLDGEPLPSLGVVRRQRGLSQRAVARQVGVAPTTLAMWESAGVRVAPGLADQLARVLDTDVTALAARPAAVTAVDPRPLRRIRRACGMSQREAAAHLRIAPGTLARYEAEERRPPVAVARRMAAVYRRPEAEMYGYCRLEPRRIRPGATWQPEDVPEGIRAARVAAGLTKVALGRAVGRSGQAVRNWEMGRTRPGPGTCRRLEAVFGFRAGQLPY